MNDDKLLFWLNGFYTLELTQLEYYLTQLKRSEDEYIAHVLLKMCESEQTHCERIKTIIQKLGAKPTRIGSYLSTLGIIPGKLTNYLGTVNLFYINYLLESIAIIDYKKLIKELEPTDSLRKELLNYLVENLIDEDLHRSWFLSRRESLKKMKD